MIGGRFCSCWAFQEKQHAGCAVQSARAQREGGEVGYSHRIHVERYERLSRRDGRCREDGCKARRGRSRRLRGRRLLLERTARVATDRASGLCFLLSFVAGRPFAELFPRSIGCCFPLQTNTTVTRRHWRRMCDSDGEDTFRLSRAAVLLLWFKPSSPNMDSLNQVRDWSSERSISARNSQLLH